MKRFPLLSIGLLILIIDCYSQNQKLDSLYSLLNKNPNRDTLRVIILNQICFYEQVSTNERNKSYAEEALAIAKEINYTKGIGSSLRSLSQYYKAKGDYEQAAQYAFEMIRVLEGTTNYKGLGQSYALVAMIYESSGELEKAKEYGLHALQIYKDHKITRSEGYAYDLLGYFHLKLQQTAEAKRYFLLAFDIRKEMNDKEALIQSYSHLAIVYKRNKEYSSAIAAIEKSMALQDELKLDDKEFLTANYNNLGEIYMLMGQYAKAEVLLLKALSTAKISDNRINMISIYETLAQMEEERKNYKQALSYTKLRNTYKDSVFNQTKESEFAKMKAVYETEKKDQTIRELQQQQEVENFKQWVLILGMTFIFIVFFVIYYLQRSYNRKTKALLANESILNERLKENDKMKSRFVANISHEFRTPLTLIMTPVEDKLLSPEVKKEDKQLFQMINRNAKQLLSLVNQLLDLSKLEAKKMELYVQKGNLKDFLTTLVASFDSLAESKEIIFDKSIAIISDLKWYDSNKIESIVNNLLINAFKFTSNKGTVSFQADQDESGNLLLIVRDTGKGIPLEEQQYLFTPFYQTAQGNSELQIGTGLGLALVKELVTLYKGTIEFESSHESGTVFRVTLPTTLEKLPDAKLMEVTTIHSVNNEITIEETPMEAVATGMDNFTSEKVLVIEDNPDLRNYIASTMHQYSVMIAQDGEQGFELAVEHIPDIIISDVMMPKLNGIDLTEKIKSDERTSHIPVILLTAKADINSRIEGFKMGADDYLAKPFSTEELVVRVSNLIEQRKKLIHKFRIAIGGSGISMANLSSLDEKFLTRAKEIIEKNLGEPDFDVEQFADQMNISRTQLFRKFKALIGLPPNEFINDVRLQRAAELIAGNIDSISQISYLVGFKEQSYFSKRFKKKFGVSPSEYK